MELAAETAPGGGSNREEVLWMALLPVSCELENSL